MAGRETGRNRGNPADRFAFCDAHLVENCRLCRLADIDNDMLAEELSARLKECLQNMRLADIDYSTDRGSVVQNINSRPPASVPPRDERRVGGEQFLPLHSTLSANYEHLPPDLVANLQAMNKATQRVAEQGQDISALTQHQDARPRTSVRRSHTTPDSLLRRPTTSRAVSQPPSPDSGLDEEETSARARKSTSVRKSLDSFLKSTKKRFGSKARRAQSASTTPTDGALMHVLPPPMPVSSRVPPLGAVEGMQVGPVPALQSGRLVTAMSAPVYEGSNIPLVIPVMNMGPSDPTLTHNNREGGLLEGTSGPHLRVHTTVDYLHYLVPGLTKVTNCGFYWGVMDRYEAEALLENKPEGTFLLRDSSQDDFIFSVSFRRYGRSLHARVEQWKHKFSFDAHDNGVFKADSVTALLEHYKDPQTCMFFEPMLTLPLNRPQPFSLLHLARAVVCDNITYDSIDSLLIPKRLQHYLRYYHYKQKIRVRTGAGWVMLRPNPAF